MNRNLVVIGVIACVIGVVLTATLLTSGLFLGPFFILGGAITIWQGLKGTPPTKKAST